MDVVLFNCGQAVRAKTYQRGYAVIPSLRSGCAKEYSGAADLSHTLMHGYRPHQHRGGLARMAQLIAELRAARQRQLRRRMMRLSRLAEASVARTARQPLPRVH